MGTAGSARGTGNCSPTRAHDWLLYHAINRNDPYFAGPTRINKRHLMLDPVDWVDGWPTVRNGRGPSDRSQQAPQAVTACAWAGVRRFH
ncbi:hypothetical protein GCM10008955_41810 [Deinococcus malanensis]|uniref:Uncharacterized protein n=1 Tax=Deinococcus malanensis TaxID=1706855 RepID=A0ABQ2F350_9DEIO|nr:hypothetical protein GCM10008955_41810 [Deinococcus malanensis]